MLRLDVLHTSVTLPPSSPIQHRIIDLVLRVRAQAAWIPVYGIGDEWEAARGRHCLRPSYTPSKTTRSSSHGHFEQRESALASPSLSPCPSSTFALQAAYDPVTFRPPDHAPPRPPWHPSCAVQQNKRAVKALQICLMLASVHQCLPTSRSSLQPSLVVNSQVLDLKTSLSCDRYLTIATRPRIHQELRERAQAGRLSTASIVCTR